MDISGEYWDRGTKVLKFGTRCNGHVFDLTQGIC